MISIGKTDPLLFYEDPDFGFVINGLTKTPHTRTQIHDHAHSSYRRMIIMSPHFKGKLTERRFPSCSSCTFGARAATTDRYLPMSFIVTLRLGMGLPE